MSPPLGSVHQLSDTIPGSVFLLSRGTFSCPANLLPWRSSGGSGVYKKSHRRAASSENVPGLERLLKAWDLTELPPGLNSSSSRPQGPPDPYEPLLPPLIGPSMGLWRECYLRGALHAQVGRQHHQNINKKADSFFRIMRSGIDYDKTQNDDLLRSNLL